MKIFLPRICMASVLVCLFLVPTRLAAQGDNCGSATLIASSPTCINTAGSVVAATTNSTVAGSPCGAGSFRDVWYRFVAVSTSHTVTISGNTFGGGGARARTEVYSGSCGTLASAGACISGNGNATYTGLTIGNTYYVRIYSNTNNTGNFNICITHTALANDNCSGAVTLTPASTCTGVSGTLTGASNSGVAWCWGISTDDDVWYSFTATAASHQVSVTGTGLNFGDIRIQIFSGTCGTLSSLACGGWDWGGRSAANYTSFTPGNTYYVRVFTETAGITLPGAFSICVLAPTLNLYADKSFVNITRGIGGGTVETGNELEVRATIVVQDPTYLGMSIDSCAFFDNIPAGTSYVPNTLSIRTNEGKLYKNFTDAANDDAGQVVGSAVRVNLGFNTGDAPATPYRRGRLKSTHIPTTSGATVFMVTYRVLVTQVLGGTINTGGGSFTYSLPSAPTTIITRNFSPNLIKVYTNNGLCNNATGINILANNLAGDFDGTFGDGNTMNRAASPNVPASYTYTMLTGNAPGDTYYGVTNNTSNNSVGYSTVNTWPKPESPSIHRIFGVFDVIGDHTGATNPTTGNSAADTTLGKTGGYMLLVNSSFSTDTVFTYRISNLCPGTYYEISAWIRNICSRCGGDSLGNGASTEPVPAGYIPTGPGDSSGVKPNLSFSIDGVNHYTTGDIQYTGGWVKKGFIFQTSSTQPDITFAISNNSPGGGGNDWVLDDISITTCTPNLSLTPTGNSNVCLGNQVDMSCLVSSVFPNYTYWTWERSDDNGATWVSTGVSGNTTPTLNGSNYEYTATYPSFIGDATTHYKQFRLKVATTPANLATGSCSFLASNRIVILVNGCQWILNTDLISFDGKLKNNQTILRWETKNEQGNVTFEVEKSMDGTHFTKIGEVAGKGSLSGSIYDFTDNETISTKAYYRIKLRENEKSQYSKMVLLSAQAMPFELRAVVNPFVNTVSFDVIAPFAGEIRTTLYDSYGKNVYSKTIAVNKGLNEMRINETSVLSSGQYVLKVQWGTQTITKRIIKLENK